MSVLVLGATGNVGPHVITALHQLGVHRPRVVVRDEPRARALFGDRADIIAGDITDPAVISRSIVGVDSVFCCPRTVIRWRTSNFASSVNYGGPEFGWSRSPARRRRFGPTVRMRVVSTGRWSRCF